MKRRRSARPEDQIQRAIVKHLDARGAKGLVFFHVPNGGYRKPVEAAIFKGLGAKAGVPDLCLIHEGKAYFLELKADKGKLTDAQEQFGRSLEAAGARWAVTHGLDAALLVLEGWGLLRGTASYQPRPLVDIPFLPAPPLQEAAE